MPIVIPIDIMYDHSVRPAWMLREPIQQETRYIRQTGGPGRFAIISLYFKPNTIDSTAVFIDDTHLDESDIANYYDDELEHFPIAIAHGMARALNELHQVQQTIVNLTITLTHFRVHPIDSNEISYRTAGEMCVKEMLTKAMLVRLN